MTDLSPICQEAKVRENRYRRMLERRGLKLAKSRRRDPHAIDYGLFTIIDPAANEVGTGRPSMTLDDVGAWLMR